MICNTSHCFFQKYRQGRERTDRQEKWGEIDELPRCTLVSGQTIFMAKNGEWGRDEK